MGYVSIEDQMFLLNAIKETNEYFEEDHSIEKESDEIQKIESLFHILENMESKLKMLSQASCIAV